MRKVITSKCNHIAGLPFQDKHFKGAYTILAVYYSSPGSLKFLHFSAIHAYEYITPLCTFNDDFIRTTITDYFYKINVKFFPVLRQLVLTINNTSTSSAYIYTLGKPTECINLALRLSIEWKIRVQFHSTCETIDTIPLQHCYGFLYECFGIFGFQTHSSCL